MYKKLQDTMTQAVVGKWASSSRIGVIHVPNPPRNRQNCTLSAQSLHKVCTKSAQSLHRVCTESAQSHIDSIQVLHVMHTVWVEQTIVQAIERRLKHNMDGLRLT